VVLVVVVMELLQVLVLQEQQILEAVAEAVHLLVVQEVVMAWQEVLV
jgi:hypothetical protein